jgi:hypothetical protein
VPEASKSCSANRCRIARCPQRFVAVILSPDRLGHLVGVRSYVAAIVKGRFGSEAEIQTEACPKMGLRGDRQNYGGTGPGFETCAAQADSATRF